MSRFGQILTRRAAWLASTAVAFTAVAIPQAAWAACDTAINPNTITCAANTTTTLGLNLNAANPSSSDPVRRFTTPARSP